jgi:hypothetical protein
MTRTQLLLRVATGAAAVLLGGCEALEPKACTMIGCSDGLTVALELRPAGAFRIELRVPGAATPYVYDCPDPSRCASGALFEELTPETATVTVTTARGTVVRDVRPAYTTSRPNGGDCPPVCRQATVTVPIPA